MRLIFVRHALPERLDTVSAAPDPELSATGLRQVAAMTQALTGERIDAVWSSPLRRAVQTGEPLAAARGLEVRQHPGLEEFDFGHGVYIPVEEATHPVVRAMKDRLDSQAGDEGLRRFQRTVVAAVDDIIAADSHESTVAIAAHGGVINAYTAAVLGVPDVIFAKLSYTGITWFTVSRQGRPRLVALNEHQHLRAMSAATSA